MKRTRGMLLVVGTMVVTSMMASIKTIDFSKLDNSYIVEINGEKVEGLKVNDRYSEYTNSIDFYVGEDNGVVVFYKNDLSGIKIVDNR